MLNDDDEESYDDMMMINQGDQGGGSPHGTRQGTVEKGWRVISRRLAHA